MTHYWCPNCRRVVRHRILNPSMPTINECSVCHRRWNPDNMTLADHAEAWWAEQGKAVPSNRESPEWQKMYLAWHTFAFKDFCTGR